MSVEAALFSHLGADPAVSALLGAGDMARVFPSQAPQGGALPYLLHRRVTERRFPHYRGSSGMVRCRVQMDIYAFTLDSALEVAEAVRDSLDGWLHAILGSGAFFVHSVQHEDRETLWERPTDGSDVGRHRVRDDYVLLYQESVPAPN